MSGSWVYKNISKTIPAIFLTHIFLMSQPWFLLIINDMWRAKSLMDLTESYPTFFFSRKTYRNNWHVVTFFKTARFDCSIVELFYQNTVTLGIINCCCTCPPDDCIRQLSKNSFLKITTEFIAKTSC